VSRACVRVRPASTVDVPALVDLVQRLDTTSGVFSGKPLDDSTAEHLAERLTAILQESDRTLLVAVDEAGDIQGLLATRHDAIGAIDLTPVLHMTHLMVVPGQRRRGIGRTLLAAAVQLAEEQGLEHVLATSAAGSREGNRYLARLGFAPLVLHRVATVSALRRSLGLADPAGRTAVLRRARLIRAQRSGFGVRPASRGA
jgi:N-acetylglutamate synthase-like GNAT family acetyltransferase